MSAILRSSASIANRLVTTGIPRHLALGDVEAHARKTHRPAIGAEPSTVLRQYPAEAAVGAPDAVFLGGSPEPNACATRASAPRQVVGTVSPGVPRS
jgi:hypothetical protein